MADAELVERLANVRSLKGLPRNELEWLADHGKVESYRAGAVFRPKDYPIPGLAIVLSGAIAIHVDRMGVQRRIMQWHGGDITGLLPYSRMVVPPGDSVIHEDSVLLTVDKEHFRELTVECPEFTAICVHTMLDRARHFSGRDFQDEKMSSLGKMSAGLAHELNNPASAANRSAKRLAEQKIEAEDSARALFGEHLNDEQLAALDEARAFCLMVPPSFLDTPLDRSDRVEAIAEWLDANGGEIDQATALAETAMNVEGLEKLALVMKGEILIDALRWLASTAAINTIGRELSESTRRISELVASVKGFTHLGQAVVAEPVNVVRGLSDTSRIMASKLRDKNITLRMELPADLPPVRGFGSELNQIWMNLIENALDAVDYGGEITIQARNRVRYAHRVGHRQRPRDSGTTSRTGSSIRSSRRKRWVMEQGWGSTSCRRLVFNQQGEIEVESEPGRTEFRVTLPLASAPATTITPSSTPATVPAG